MPDLVTTLLLVTMLLVLASLLQPVASRLAVPHSVLLAGLGIGFGALAAISIGIAGLGPLGEAMHALAELEITAEAILYIFLPILLFESGLTIDVRRMMDDIAPIMLLAIVAVIVCTFVVGVTLSTVTQASLVACLMFGAIVATTDPVAVIGIFRDLGAPRRLSILVEGESLFNDAAAITLFTVLVGILITGSQVAPVNGALLFGKVFIGGLIVGYAAARLTVLLLKFVHNVPVAEITITVALPYLVYILSEHLHVSGVVAVVTAALTIGASGRINLSPSSWEKLVHVWEQIGFWASTLIFIFASMLIPRFLEDVGLADAGLLVIVVLAALGARALVLWGLLPLLSAWRVAEKVSAPYKLVILWGGLRGAVTLALALAVTENPNVPAEIKRFVALQATGFVLFTLLVQATTLRSLMRLLRLDRLDPVDAALRNRAIALGISSVAERIEATARTYRLPPDRAQEIAQGYRARLTPEERGRDRLNEAEQLKLGLVTLAAREEELYIGYFASQAISRRTVVELIAKAGRLRDGAKVAGLQGYLNAAKDGLRFRPSFRTANLIHRLTGISGPLSKRLEDRFETLLISRLVVEELASFTDHKLGPLIDQEARTRLSEVLATRLGNIERALEALRLQYPDYAAALAERFLRQTAVQMESAEYQALLHESVINREIFNDLRQRLDADWQSVARRPQLDLGLRTIDLVRRFPMFDGFPDERLRDICELFRPRFAFPGERLIVKGERGEAMFLVSSGAVEVALPGGAIRLGRGDFFGELALLTNRRRTADVVAIGYCRLLMLSGRDFRQFIKAHPDIRVRIREIAAERMGEPGRAAE